MTTESGHTPARRKALGRGISALLEGRTAPPSLPIAAPPAAGVRHVAVDHIQPNPHQPRRSFHPDRLNELAASIRANGLVQPVLLRPAPGGKFQVIAGERRWRAARIAGLETIPALVEEIPDDRILEVALVENIQREDLNAIEQAQAYETLAREFNLTHDEIARRTGKDRTTITNFLRLLRLPAEVQQMLADDKLSMGHARALLGLLTAAEQKAAALKIAAKGLSVRATERLVARMTARPREAPAGALDPNTRAAVQEMERSLGTRVRIVETRAGRGRIEIEFYSPDDLDRIYGLIVR